VPSEILNPRDTWSDKSAYDAKRRDLAARFRKNFEAYEEQATPAVRQAGPVG
jgi:phosphoenolpyruvate carboxykinase (ATP)